MIRIIAKLFALTVVLTAFLYVAPAFAQEVVWISSTGSDTNSCTAAQPCATFAGAIARVSFGGQINCLNSPGFVSPNGVLERNLTIDCAGVWEVSSANVVLTLLGGAAVKIRNLTMSGGLGGPSGGISAIKVTGSGSLIIENCVFENFFGPEAAPALDIEPNAALNLVVANSRISTNEAGGILLKPAAGGSVTATFDHVTITNNAGGLRTDTTNGAVRVDISNSTISNNANNGLIAIGGTGGTNMVTVKNGVIASNGQAGIEASGANAAVLVNNAVLDSNTGGALQAVSSGKILTYQNNTVIGSPGSGFTGTAAPQ
jgi:Right handed beta helix region